MRSYHEPTCANFLKEPLVFGVRLMPLLLLLLVSGMAQVLLSVALSIGITTLGYGALLIQARFGKNGSEEALIYFLEKKLKIPPHAIKKGVHFEIQSHDTLDQDEQIAHKAPLEESLREIPPGENRIISLDITPAGASLRI